MMFSFIFPSNNRPILKRKMNTSVWRWLIFTILFTAFHLLGLAGVALYADVRDGKKSLQRTVSCSYPTAELSKRKTETIPSAMPSREET
jgi:hypothetical protein